MICVWTNVIEVKILNRCISRYTSYTGIFLLVVYSIQLCVAWPEGVANEVCEWICVHQVAQTAERLHVAQNILGSTTGLDVFH